MPFITTPRLTVHYETAGAGATPLVLVHGNFGTWRWWRPLFDRLPPDARAYAPDLRGCGDSDRSGPHTIPALADDLAAFADTLGLAHFHLLGHSLGGAVALEFALRQPERAQTLALVAPAPAEGMPMFRNTSTPAPWLTRLFDLKRDTALAQLDTGYRFWRTLGANRHLLRRALQRLTPTLRHDDAFEALVDDAARMSPKAVIGHLRSLDDWNVQAQLSRIKAPTLIVWGERDILVPRPALERMVSRLPRGRLVVWPDTGHAPQLEQPDRFAMLLSSFIRENTPATTRHPLNWLEKLRVYLKT